METCECGDVYDEHEYNGGTCTVTGCFCLAFDPAETTDDEW